MTFLWKSSEVAICLEFRNSTYISQLSEGNSMIAPWICKQKMELEKSHADLFHVLGFYSNILFTGQYPAKIAFLKCMICKLSWAIKNEEKALFLKYYSPFRKNRKTLWTTSNRVTSFCQHQSQLHQDTIRNMNSFLSCRFSFSNNFKTS